MAIDLADVAVETIGLRLMTTTTLNLKRKRSHASDQRRSQEIRREINLD